MVPLWFTMSSIESGITSSNSYAVRDLDTAFEEIKLLIFKATSDVHKHVVTTLIVETKIKLKLPKEIEDRIEELDVKDKVIKLFQYVESLDTPANTSYYKKKFLEVLINFTGDEHIAKAARKIILETCEGQVISKKQDDSGEYFLNYITTDRARSDNKICTAEVYKSANSNTRDLEVDDIEESETCVTVVDEREEPEICITVVDAKENTLLSSLGHHIADNFILVPKVPLRKICTRLFTAMALLYIIVLTWLVFFHQAVTNPSDDKFLSVLTGNGNLSELEYPSTLTTPPQMISYNTVGILGRESSIYIENGRNLATITTMPNSGQFTNITTGSYISPRPSVSSSVVSSNPMLSITVTRYDRCEELLRNNNTYVSVARIFVHDPDKWPDNAYLPQAERIRKLYVGGNISIRKLLHILGQTKNVTHLILSNGLGKLCLWNHDSLETDFYKIILNQTVMMKLEHFSATCSAVFSGLLSNIQTPFLKGMFLKNVSLDYKSTLMIHRSFMNYWQTLQYLKLQNTYESVESSIFSRELSKVLQSVREISLDNPAHIISSQFCNVMPNLSNFISLTGYIGHEQISILRDCIHLSNIVISLKLRSSFDFSLGRLFIGMEKLESLSVSLIHELCTSEDLDTNRLFIKDIHLLPETVNNMYISSNCRISVPSLLRGRRRKHIEINSSRSSEGLNVYHCRIKNDTE